MASQLFEFAKLIAGLSWARWKKQYDSCLYTRAEGPPTKARLTLIRAKLKHLHSGSQRPHLRILCTNLTSGEMGYFDRSGYHQYLSENLPPTHHLNPDIDLSRAVAASSAFPVIFSPVFLTNGDYGGAIEFPRPQALADGGIYENLGLEASLRSLHEHDYNPPIELIPSDGQAVFLRDDERRFSLLASRARRTIEILMRRVACWQIRTALQSLRESNTIGVFRHKPSSQVTMGKSALNPAVQNQIARLRTDLNDFSDLEIDLLIFHGYSVARAVYEPNEDDIPGIYSIPPNDAYAYSVRKPRKAKLRLNK